MRATQVLYLLPPSKFYIKVLYHLPERDTLYTSREVERLKKMGSGGAVSWINLPKSILLPELPDLPVCARLAPARVCALLRRRAW